MLGQLDIRYIATHDDVADFMTKPLVPRVFHGHRNTLCVVHGEEVM